MKEWLKCEGMVEIWQNNCKCWSFVDQAGFMIVEAFNNESIVENQSSTLQMHY